MPIGLKGNSDGSGAIQIGGSDAISISTGLNTTFAGTITATGTVAGTTGTLYPLVSGTAVSATGTAIDFTGIPSWVRRVTVMFSGVSTNGTSNYLVQIGGGGSFAVAGYVSMSGRQAGNATNEVTSTAGYIINIANAASIMSGQLTISLVSGNTWVSSLQVGTTGVTATVGGGGSTNIGVQLDRVRITTVNGTDTFDAGTINLLWE